MPNPSLPFFAYGFLREGEIAYPRIQPFVDVAPTPATIPGRLWLRDGVLLLELNHRDRHVSGDLFRFAHHEQDRAYAAIVDLEQDTVYEWREARVAVSGDLVVANVLVARNPRMGRPEPISGDEWSSAKDPLFNEALNEVERIANEPDPRNPEDLGVFFRKQMAYLLLWSSIERYASLRYALGRRGATEKVKRIARCEYAFEEALRLVVSSRSTVSQAHNPRQQRSLDSNDPVASFDYYHQIRNNLVHRGKMAFQDRQLIADALNQLLFIHRHVLQSTLRHRT
jgi:gamma-glutamylcyclotransferase (GGCT)/AIG2-like uncharacterized protein YtfP